jgi:hypothetical protein
MIEASVDATAHRRSSDSGADALCDVLISVASIEAAQGSIDQGIVS